MSKTNFAPSVSEQVGVFCKGSYYLWSDLLTTLVLCLTGSECDIYVGGNNIFT